MADSDITVAGLAAATGTGKITLSYTVADPHENGGLPYLSLGVVEVWAATTNDRSLATKVAEGNKTTAFHTGLAAGAIWYYWIKARNRSGSYGDYFPAGATDGVSATVFSDGEIWTPFTSTVTSTTGTLTSVSANGTYKLTGKTCTFNVFILISTNGTGATAILFTLPFTANSTSGDVAIASGVREGSPSRAAIMCLIGNAAVTGIVYLYDGTYPGADNAFLYISGQYEID